MDNYRLSSKKTLTKNCQWEHVKSAGRQLGHDVRRNTHKCWFWIFLSICVSFAFFFERVYARRVSCFSRRILGWTDRCASLSWKWAERRGQLRAEIHLEPPLFLHPFTCYLKKWENYVPPRAPLWAHSARGKVAHNSVEIAAARA